MQPRHVSSVLGCSILHLRGVLESLVVRLGSDETAVACCCKTFLLYPHIGLGTGTIEPFLLSQV